MYFITRESSAAAETVLSHRPTLYVNTIQTRVVSSRYLLVSVCVCVYCTVLDMMLVFYALLKMITI